MMFGGLELLIPIVGIGIFLWLRSREQKRGEQGLTKLANWRLVLATLFGLVALFAGGCTLLLVPDALRRTQYIDPAAIAIIGGIPFLISALITWALLRRKDKTVSGDTAKQEAHKPDKQEGA